VSARLFDVYEPLPASDEGKKVCGDHATGIAAEAELVAALLKLGHKVAIPCCDDDGVDLIVNYRTLVQVKASAHRNPRGLLKVGGGARGPLIRDHVDIFAAHALDSGAWWFVPGDVFRSSGANNGVWFAEHARNVRCRATMLSGWRDAWHVFDYVDGEAA
jgi:hypothetical protein